MAEFKKDFFGFLSLATTSISKRYLPKRRFVHLSDNYKNDVLRKSPITLSKLTTGGVSFQS